MCWWICRSGVCRQIWSRNEQIVYQFEFFYGESNTAVRDIVSAIEDQVETLDDATYEITEVDQPEMPFYRLLTTIAAMILLAFVTKV